MSTDEIYAPLIEAAFQAIVTARGRDERRAAGAHFTRLIAARNRARTAQEIERRERAKGLRE